MSRLSEIEGKIAALRERHAELDSKMFRPDRRFDGAVLSALGLVEMEIKRLEGERERAMVDDLIEKEPTDETKPGIPATPRAPAALPLPFDFPNDDVPEADPLKGLERLPQGDDYVQLQQRLASFCTEQVGDFIKSVRAVFKNARPVSYTQAQHVGIQAALGFVLAQTRLLVATGRDRRDALERKLLARIEALERHPQLRYQGIWNAEKTYGEGNLTTDQGSLFHANRATIGERPGSSDSWTLVCKRGRDGKDAR